jgi:hypothetical protein
LAFKDGLIFEGDFADLESAFAAALLVMKNNSMVPSLYNTTEVLITLVV